jgi:aryl-alcohol dehydrogenase-like predicted oxidoreductase
MHWPERVMNMFGKRGLTEIDNQWKENFFEVLTVFDGLIKEGKIKHIGVSNENPYGVMKFISESENTIFLELYQFKIPIRYSIDYLKLGFLKFACAKILVCLHIHH